MPRVSSVISNTQINEDGVVIQKDETKTTYHGKEPNYVKLYLDNILYLSDLPKGLNSVLFALLKKMNYDNELVLNAAIKRKIAKDINLSVSRVNNAITDFVKGQLLLRVDKGLYEVNPHLFGKGEWANISKIRLNVTFDSKGKTLKSVIEKGDGSESEQEYDFDFDSYETAGFKEEEPPSDMDLPDFISEDLDK
jgi:hypothetical protein